MRRMCLWCPIVKRNKIIMWIHVNPNWKANFNSKNDRREVFLMKLKHQYHLSQWGEWIGGAQSIKERRLSCEFIFIPIEKRTSILKMVERKTFLMKQNISIIYPNGKNVFMVPNHEKKRDYYVNLCSSQLKVEL